MVAQMVLSLAVRLALSKADQWEKWVALKAALKVVSRGIGLVDGKVVPLAPRLAVQLVGQWAAAKVAQLVRLLVVLMAPQLVVRLVLSMAGLWVDH